MKPRALLLTVPFMVLLELNGWWAEPSKPETLTTFSVKINRNKAADTELEQELDVEQMEEMDCDTLKYLACAVQAEAGTETIEGKRMVVATILNRVDSEDFPNDIHSVLEQKGQFSKVSNGSIDRVKPTEETWQAIALELASRSDDTVVYFRAGKYHDCGHPVCQIGRHYFSSI